MKAHIEIKMDNAVFEDAGHSHELARMLRELANRLERDDKLAELCQHGGRHNLRDVNGNTVGKLVVT